MLYCSHSRMTSRQKLNSQLTHLLYDRRRYYPTESSLFFQVQPRSSQSRLVVFSVHRNVRCSCPRSLSFLHSKKKRIIPTYAVLSNSFSVRAQHLRRKPSLSSLPNSQHHHLVTHLSSPHYPLDLFTLKIEQLCRYISSCLHECEEEGRWYGEDWRIKSAVKVVSLFGTIHFPFQTLLLSLGNKRRRQTKTQPF